MLSPAGAKDFSFTTVSILALGTYRALTKWLPVFVSLKNHALNGLCANLFLLCRWSEVFWGLFTSFFHNVLYITHSACVPAQMVCRIY
jgi:hypothetical protein